MMYGDEKSDLFIVAGKPANGDGRPEPERVERREGAEENTRQTSTRRTPSRASVSPGLDRVRTAARLDRKERFTALPHHVDAGLLRRAYFGLKRGRGRRSGRHNMAGIRPGSRAQARRWALRRGALIEESPQPCPAEPYRGEPSSPRRRPALRRRANTPTGSRS